MNFCLRRRYFAAILAMGILPMIIAATELSLVGRAALRLLRRVHRRYCVLRPYRGLSA